MKKIKLFCFPYAGGASYSFVKWKRYLHDSIELCTVELAGRGSRLGSPFYQTIGEAVEDIFTSLKNEVKDNSYTLFGHSMGAVVIFELLNKINEADFQKPLHVFFSGRNPPHKKEKRILHNLDDNLFKQELLKLGGTPLEIFGKFDNPRSAVLHGISIYKGYYNDLYNVFSINQSVLKSSPIILRTMKSLIESKYGLLFRVEYLNNNNYIKNNELLKGELNFLVDTLEKAFYLMIKCAETLESKYFEKACTEFERAEKSDVLVLAELVEVLYLLLKNRI